MSGTPTASSPSSSSKFFIQWFHSITRVEGEPPSIEKSALCLVVARSGRKSRRKTQVKEKVRKGA